MDKQHEYSDGCTCLRCKKIRRNADRMFQMFAEHGIVPLVVDPDNDPDWADKVAGRVGEEAVRIMESRGEG